MGTNSWVIFRYRNLYVRIWNQFGSHPNDLGERLLKQIRGSLQNNYWLEWKQRMFNIYMVHQYGANVFMDHEKFFIQQQLKQDSFTDLKQFYDDNPFPFYDQHPPPSFLWNIQTQLRTVQWINRYNYNMYDQKQERFPIITDPIRQEMSLLFNNTFNVKNHRVKEDVSREIYVNRMKSDYIFEYDTNIDAVFDQDAIDFVYSIDFKDDYFNIHDGVNTAKETIDTNNIDMLCIDGMEKKYDFL